MLKIEIPDITVVLDQTAFVKRYILYARIGDVNVGEAYAEIVNKDVIYNGAIENRRVCYLNRIHVNSDQRKRGIGTTLSDKVREIGDSESCTLFQTTLASYAFWPKGFVDHLRDLGFLI